MTLFPENDSDQKSQLYLLHDQTVFEAFRFMFTNNRFSLPVYKDASFLSSISFADLINFCSQMQNTTEELLFYKLDFELETVIKLRK